MNYIDKQIEEIINKVRIVEFLHGVPVSLPSETVKLLRSGIRGAIAQAGQEGYKRGVKAVELPTYDHLKCPIRETCIGYQNAGSDLQNVKDVLLASLDTTDKNKCPKCDGWLKKWFDRQIFTGMHCGNCGYFSSLDKTKE